MPTETFLEAPQDIQHDWVWGLSKGEKVWVAIEEMVASTSRFSIDFLDEVGPAEFEATSEMFMPYEMEVLNNWILKSGDTESHIISLQYTNPKVRKSIRFACQCKHSDLTNFFLSRHSEVNVASTHIFRTQEECSSFCAEYIAQNFSVELCDAWLEGLSQIKERILGVRRICAANEESLYGEADYATAVANIMD